METLSVINLLPSSKEQVKIFSNDIVSQVKAGVINPLTLKMQMKFIEKTFSEIDKEIKDNVMDEASKYGKSFQHNGWKVDEVEAGVTYDFTRDNEWLDLREKIKERETFLKSLKSPLEIVDTETGETKTLLPPIRKSTTSLKFTAI